VTLVLDASVVVAATVDDGDDGDWARAILGGGHLLAPHLLPVEVTNTLRRLVLAGRVTASAAHDALRDLRELAIEHYPFEPFAERVWELRSTITAYDAWYVALAEVHDAPLATLDARLAGAAGPDCRFALPQR
jgi:predicted nucleic acid-binding protein